MKKSLKRILLCNLTAMSILGTGSIANAQTYCPVPVADLDNEYDYIHNVTFAGINNTSGMGSSAYEDFTSATPGVLTIGEPSAYSITIESDYDEYVTVFIDWNQNGVLNDPGEVYTVVSGSVGFGSLTYTGQITPPTSALTGNTRMRVLIDWDNENNGDPCLGFASSSIFGSFGEVEDYTITVQNVAVTAVEVATQGGVPAVIDVDGGDLEMTANVIPASASQDVTWSIVPGTGTATISATGLVTATSNGTVWAKAVSNVDATKMDSLQISISNQVLPITGIAVSTEGGAAATITSNEGTLQMTASVLPATADQGVTWSIVQGTGNATISASGLVTAAANGSVWAKAVSTQDDSFSDSLEISITGQGVGLKGLFATNEIEIYPVPFDNDLTIDMKSINTEGMYYKFSNILGQVLKQGPIIGKNITMNTSLLPAGMYTISLVDPGGKVSSLQVTKH